MKFSDLRYPQHFVYKGVHYQKFDENHGMNPKYGKIYILPEDIVEKYDEDTFVENRQESFWTKLLIASPFIMIAIWLFLLWATDFFK